MIRTPAAVAGVRGTDFVVTHKQGGDITKVETLEGIVELGGHNQTDKTTVKKGQYASFVVLASSGGVFDESAITSFVQKGFLTPVYKLAENQRERLQIELDFQDDGSDRIVASNRNQKEDETLCQSPKGQFNQCLWKCENNPSGQSTCRTDLSGVSCVRKKCDLNGRWSQTERVPASTGTVQCSAEGAVVGACDY